MKPNLVFTGVYLLVAGGAVTLLSVLAVLPSALILGGMGLLGLGVLIAIVGTWG